MSLPDVPAQLVRDTDDLLRKLDATIDSLRVFSERLHAARGREDEENNR